MSATNTHISGLYMSLLSPDVLPDPTLQALMAPRDKHKLELWKLTNESYRGNAEEHSEQPERMATLLGQLAEASANKGRPNWMLAAGMADNCSKLRHAIPALASMSEIKLTEKGMDVTIPRTYNEMDQKPQLQANQLYDLVSNVLHSPRVLIGASWIDINLRLAKVYSASADYFTEDETDENKTMNSIAAYLREMASVVARGEAPPNLPHPSENMHVSSSSSAANLPSLFEAQVKIFPA